MDELKMKKQGEELCAILNQPGDIGRLRKRLISLLICVEDLFEDMRANGEGTEEIVGLASKIELLLGEFAMSQQMADRMIVGLTPRERISFIKEVPEILKIFGWHDKFDENGNIKNEP